MSERIGFVGLGIMRLAMARNLANAGFELTAFNRTSTKAEEFVEGNQAAVAYSLAELARQSDVVITMLPDPPEVEAVVSGEGGLLDFAHRGTLLIDMSTSSPVLARRLAAIGLERGGVGMLDAPVSGGDIGAEEVTLSIMAGDEAEAFEKAKPLFEAMGETVVHVGESGSGQVAKAANQVVVALVLQAASEALVLGSGAGVDPGKLIDVLSGGLAANKAMDVKREKFLTRDFEPGGKVAFHYKDLGIALETGREYGVAL